MLSTSLKLVPVTSTTSTKSNEKTAGTQSPSLNRSQAISFAAPLPKKLRKETRAFIRRLSFYLLSKLRMLKLPVYGNLNRDYFIISVPM